MKPRIAIVDDEPEICNLLTLFLEEDFEVSSFMDPREACEKVNSTQFSLVISDIKMPFLTGLEVLQHIKSVSPQTVVVLITGHAQSEKDKEKAKEMGATNVLFKPFGDPEKLVAYFKSIIPLSDGSPAVSVGKPPILIIDDEPDLTDILSLLLGDDYQVKVFNEVLAAIENLKTCSYKAVITDLNMPQLSGAQVVRSIRAICADVPIIVMTGLAESDPMVVESVKAGNCEALIKPFADPDVVLNKLKKVVK